MQQLLHPICLALAGLGFLLLLWPPERLRRDRALAALAGVYGFSAVSFLVSLEPVRRTLDDLTGRPSTGILAAFGYVEAMPALQPVVLAHWDLSPEQARRRSRWSPAAGAAVVTALAVLFFQLTPTGRSTPHGFTVNYLHDGVYQGYLTLSITAYVIGEAYLVARCRRVARRTGEVWIARGLRIVAAGAVLTFGYSAVRLAAVATADRLRAALAAYRCGETSQNPAEYADAATREDLRTPDDDVRALVRIAAHFTTADAGKDPSPSWT
ncbi:hypothetical protein [Streptomyces macrosporus]|uniref:Integral membrane protein n=1 Tax=Streptomyces macrosporus TaxID=44032 RepID=A0ABP5XFX8_9ACTN